MLLLVLGLGAALAVFWTWKAGDADGAVGPERGGPFAAELPSDEPERAPPNPTEPAPADARAEVRQEPATAPTASEPTAVPAAKGARGSIRGSVHVEPGLELPDVWRAVVEPSPFFRGERSGVRRTVEVTGGGNRFAFDELPLAGYAVHVEAAGFNSLPQHVLLTAGSEAQVVTLALSPTGFLDGFVLDRAGRPVERLLVTLEAEGDRSRRGVETQADGSFVFPDVLDGNYTIYFGSPEAPLVEPKSLAFKAPAMRVPETEVPVLGRLTLSTFDGEGRPLPDVDVRGFGSKGGELNALTDDRGRCTIGLLRPGRYKLFASTEDGREGRTHVDVSSGETVEIEIRLSPR